jgi:hypothetical protein
MTFTVPTQASSAVVASTTSAVLTVTTLNTASRIYWYAIPTTDATAATVSKALVLNPVAKTGVVFNNAAIASGSPTQSITGLTNGLDYKLYYVFVSDADKTSSQLFSVDLSTMHLAVAGVTAPVVAATGVTSVTTGNGYTGTVTWAPNEAFVAGKVYVATITLTAVGGYSLTGVAANSFTVAGATVTNSADAGVLTATFTALTIPAGSFTVAGVTAPVTGETPITTVTAKNEYTGTVAWSSSGVALVGNFVASTVYTATITLTPVAGFSLANSFGVGKTYTVAGSTTVNQPTALTGTTLVFTVEFPPTLTA